MIDFHCHLDLYPNARRLIDQVAARNHFTLAVTTNPRAWQATSRVIGGRDNIKVALGMHPEIVRKKAAERQLLISCVAQAGFIGEVGLDGSMQHQDTRGLQDSILKDLLMECERCGGKIISIHSRNAAGCVLDHIEQHCRASVPVLHWFSGTIEETRRAVLLGCWFSVGPAMLCTAKGRRLLEEIPTDRFLPETDGPFARNGLSPYMPWDAMAVVGTVAAAWNKTPQDVREQFLHNLRTLLRFRARPF
jgi:TatD DNase family protein